VLSTRIPFREACPALMRVQGPQINIVSIKLDCKTEFILDSSFILCK
jgi:hypothetical protein